MSICNVCTGKKLVSTSELLGSITVNVLRAVAFCTRAFAKFKPSGTVHIEKFASVIWSTNYLKFTVLLD